MVKSMWVVEENGYDCFTGNECRQTRFSSMQEAFGRYKERKAFDFDYGDHCRCTTIFHTFVYQDEEKARQAKSREERRRSKEAEEWETGPMTEEEYEASGIRVLPSCPTESEFPTESEDEGIDLDDVDFDLDDHLSNVGAAFNGLVDGAGEFPLWENSSRK